MTYRWVAAAGAAWTAGYVVAYFMVVARQGGVVAWWYVVLLLAGVVALAVAASGHLVRAALWGGFVIAVASALVGLLSVGVFLLPAAVAAAGALLLLVWRPESTGGPSSRR
jgi:hypothetical protein